MQRLYLRHKFALGDTVLLTGLVRDIQAQYPGKFEIIVDTHCREVWENNPHCRTARGNEGKSAGDLAVDISYKNGIHAAGRGQKIHMLAWYHHDFAYKTGLALAPLQPKGDLHLTPQELVPLVRGRYWLVLAGGKIDITAKWWWPGRWQQTVDRLRDLGITCVQAGAAFNGHKHPKLTGVLNLVGMYPSARQFMNLIYHADGVIGPVTGAMHIAACFDKPCVVLSGGREEFWWEHYSEAYGAFGASCQPVKIEHRFLHTLGLLDCCKKKGCWLHRTTALGNNDRYDKPALRCKLPVIAGAEHTPRCLDLIQVDHVIEAVMSYYERGEVPPIGQPKGTYSLHPPGGPANAVETNFTSTVKSQPVNDLKTKQGVTTIISPPPVPSTPSPSAQMPGVLHESAMQSAISNSVFEFVSPPPLISHPLIGGKFTLFVLCYGPHAELARTCLDSILKTVPARCLDIRVGCNAVEPATLDYLKTLPITRIYNEPGNIKKYPLMRKMFNDPECPISTPYILWFDDDAKVISENWLADLCEAVIVGHPTGHRLYGWPMIHDTGMFRSPTHDPLTWFRQATWWKGRHLRVKGRGMEASNGTIIPFVPGWFWAMATETVRSCDIPDRRLNHNGGDATIGEQVHQGGWKIMGFNHEKKHIWCPSKENGGRRGYFEPFPWRDSAKQR